MEKVSFIRIEDDPPDLILSFAIWQPELDDIRSLILMRTPQYEFIFNEAEHGVKVSDEAWLNDEDEILKEIEFDGDAVTIVTESHKFELCRNSGDTIPNSPQEFRRNSGDTIPNSPNHALQSTALPRGGLTAALYIIKHYL